MKATFVAAAAALLAGGASAGHVQHRHAHDLFKYAKRANDTGVCVPGCTTIYSTITGSAIWVPTPAPTTSKSTPAPVVTPSTTTTAPILVPTPIAQTCPTPGTYTFPATTVVVTETTTVCGASTTKVPAGTHTLGGVTTVVATSTTVVCPYATTETQAGVVTAVIKTTTYVCPSAGTYTIGPVTTVVATETVVAVPVVTSYLPGTYTADAQIVTVTETNYVYYCPFTTPAPPAPAAATAAPPPPPPPASTPEPPKSKPSPQAGGPIQTTPQMGMTYTPYNTDGTCKSAEAVKADIAVIASHGFGHVRSYATDCDTLPNVGDACAENGIKLITGIFINGGGCDINTPDIAEQVADTVAWGRWELVDMVLVGNEALFNGYCSPQQLANLIVAVKEKFGAAGYTGLYSTTDVTSAWIGQDVSAICNAVDFPCVNSHAIFNHGTKPEEAGDFVAGQLEIVEAVCGGKKGYVAETGWPTNGRCFGEETCPGKQQQAVAIASIKEKLGSKAIFFSYCNDDWKDPNTECQCEQFWGTETLFGTVFTAA
ncbi:glycoside hydrolase [Coniochaeta sp. 2T2.1]|nr:glycoside hydrolase [Coniochaeta sp. 2T2.1]